MGNAKKRTTTTIATMLIIAIAILVFYYYWSNRTDPIKNTSGDNLSEVEKLLDKDLTLYYPETPRELVKLFAAMNKAIYDNPDDAKLKDLAIKIRELYDQEFLDNTPEDTYLNNLLTELAEWKKNDRTITNYILVNKDSDQESQVDGVNYSTIDLQYTIQENRKYTEIWKVLMRQNEEKQWKILGWQLVPQKDSSK